MRYGEGEQTIAILKGVDSNYNKVAAVNKSIARGRFDTGDELAYRAVLGVELEMAANPDGRLGLHVPHVLLRRPAPQVDQDARFRFGRGAKRHSTIGAGQALGAEQLGESHCAQANSAQTNHRIPPVQHQRRLSRRRRWNKVT